MSENEKNTTVKALEAYCVKCKTKRPIQNPEPYFTPTGRAAVRGTCPVCGTTLIRFGRVPEHDHLPPPDPAQVEAAKARSKAKKASTKKNTKTKRTRTKGSPIERLVIVESPTKARTMDRFLGKGYVVRASKGHVRDLLKSRLSVDVEHDFQPRYTIPKDKRPIVKQLKEEAARAKEVYLATDPDREGEAIAWHLMQAAEIPEEKVQRVVFHEITQEAIQEAFRHPRSIDMDLVNAQQARRVLDRLVGYKVSPLLWKRVRSGTSAGRVQSVALRLVVEREREIQAFVPEEYWTITAELARQADRQQPERPTFKANLHRIDGKEPDLKNEADAQRIISDLQGAVYIVEKVKRGQRRRKPAPPFTTSTMQQEASRRLGFTAQRTMRLAQQLYEGIDLGPEGRVGLITYMRTDSVHVAEVAQKEARAYIAKTHGPEFLPPRPPKYKTRTRGAQEAHEAIRPTSVFRTPAKVKPYLSPEQYKLYELIWRRFVASQMAPAVYDTLTVDISAGPATGKRPYLFRASGSQVRFPGFLIVYEEARDENDEGNGKGNGKIRIPELSVGDVLDLIRLIPEQHFTQPPPRYTEATLVRALEEHGIGRPSTYAPILTTLRQRGYVERRGKSLVPTELGFTVNDLLVEYFPSVFEVGFTARMEEGLDKVASGEQNWVQLVREFYEPFSEMLKVAESSMPDRRVPDQPTGEVCELCGAPMVIKTGRYGKFIACSNYPKCKNTKPYLEKIGVKCPECGADLVIRRTRKGRVFYGCSRYPECTFSVWDRPLPQPCPKCGGLLVMKGKKKAQCIKCGTWYNLEELEQVHQEETEDRTTPVPTPA